MRCYRQHESHAIVICRYCGNATCPDFCEDTGQGIASCSACAEEFREPDSREPGASKALASELARQPVRQYSRLILRFNSARRL